MREALNRGAAALLELIYPRRAECMGCGSRAGFERIWLCEDCRRSLADRWEGVADPPPGGLFEGAAYGYRYGGPAAGLVRNLKYRGVRGLDEWMGRHMARAFEPLQPAHIDFAVPVPMHPKRLRQRGYNHAALLANRAAEGLGIPVMEALSRVRYTRQQARLDEAGRRDNQEGAFALTADVTGKRVLLVDDVCTTGATANACARTLLAGGASVVYLLCFAVAQHETDN